MSEPRRLLPGEDPGWSCSSFGSDDIAPIHPSSSFRPPKKRRFYLLPNDCEPPACSTAEAPSVPACAADHATSAPAVRIDLDALTYYPPRDSTFEGGADEHLELPLVVLTSKRPASRSERSIRTAIRLIAKQRRKRLSTLF